MGWSKYPLVSFIIVNYNRKDDLGECIESIKNQNYPAYEIIVVDNGSTDGSVEFLINNYPEVKLIINNKNVGAAKGRNIGVRVSRGKYLAFLDSDAIIDKDWTREMVSLLESDPKIGVGASKVLKYESPHILNSAGGLCDVIALCPLRGSGEENKGKYNKIEPVFYAHSCACMVRRDIFEKLGGFDEKFFVYVEEVDFCWRVWMLGYKVIYNPKAVAYHKQLGSTHTPFEKTVKRQFLVKRNKMYMLIKNHDLRTLVMSLPLFLTFSVSEAIYYIISRRSRLAKAIFDGIIWNLRNLDDTLREREKVKFIRANNKIPFSNTIAIHLITDILKGKTKLPL